MQNVMNFVMILDRRRKRKWNRDLPADDRQGEMRQKNNRNRDLPADDRQGER